MPQYGLESHKETLIAHLLRECGSVTEYCDWSEGKESNDNGWAVGIAQWHLWYREQEFVKSQGCWYKNPRVWSCDIPKLRAAYFKAHPEMTDWRHQAHRYLGDMKVALERKGTITGALRTWNSGATYISDVTAKKPMARQLLSL